MTHANCLDLLPIFEELEQYYFREQSANREQLAHYLVNKVFSDYSGVKVIAAYEGDVVVGFATFSLLYPAPKLAGQMYMKDLFVSAQTRGKGVGVKLIKVLAKIALEQGCQRLDWTAESSNPSAIEFYQFIGATLVEEKRYFRMEGEQLSAFSEC